MTDTPGRDQELKERRGPKQASIAPVTTDGVLPFKIGLGISCAVMLLSLLPAAPDWLSPVAAVAALIGSIGLVYCWQRRDKNGASQTATDPS